MDDSEIEKEVPKSIAEVISKFLQNITPYLLSLSCVKVDGNYGRNMMTGHLRSMGVSILKRKVGNALKKICPNTQAERCMQAGRSFNPKVSKADYFGHKLHVDENEKFLMHGVSHVLACHGYSGMIYGYTTMAIKNNLTIYEKMFL